RQLMIPEQQRLLETFTPLAVSAQTGTPGNSRRKVNVGNKRNDTGINRVCASSQKWIEVLVYRFFPAPAALWAIPGIS
ncbi:hypothetical protein ACLBPU_30825, partial [Klebsiella pneumoniae]